MSTRMNSKISSKTKSNHDLSKIQEEGKNLTNNKLLSEFEKWANEVLSEYIRQLKVSKLDASSKTSGFVFSIQDNYQLLAKGLREIVLDLYPENPMIPYLHILHKILRPAVVHCVTDLDNPRIDEERYSRLVSDVNFLINLKLDKNRAWAFLHQFGCLSNFVELDGPLRIRRATYIELYIFDLTNQSVGGRTHCEFIAETTSDISFVKTDGNHIEIDNAKVLEDFRTLVTALRLTTPSSTGLNTVSIICHLFGGAAAFTINLPALMQFNPAPEIFPGAFSPYVNTQCILDKFELVLFQRLYKRLREINTKEGAHREQVQRALRRYNVALISDQAEDSIVDAVIALEILFKAGGFKMAFRASLLSSITPDERQLIVQTLEKCHRVRSEIVHGGSSKKQEYKSLLGKLILITCRVFRSYLYTISMGTDVISFIKTISYDPKQLASFQKEIAKWSQAKTSWIWNPSESLADIWKDEL